MDYQLLVKIIDNVISTSKVDAFLELFKPYIFNEDCLVVPIEINLADFLDNTALKNEYSDEIDKEFVNLCGIDGINDFLSNEIELPNSKEERYEYFLGLNRLKLNLLYKFADNNGLDKIKYFIDLRRNALDNAYFPKELILEELKEKGYDDLVEIINGMVNDDSFAKLYVDISGYDYEIIYKLLTMLQDNEEYHEFISSEDDYYGYSKHECVRYLAEIFGNNEMDICEDNNIYEFNFVNQEIIDRYLSLRRKFNVDKDVMIGDPFYLTDIYEREEQQFVDDDWVLDEKLKDKLLDGIEEYNTSIEKIAFIYYKLCLVLGYNGIYTLFNGDHTQYVKENMEMISLDFPYAMCAEASKILCKLINKLDNSIDARCCNDTNLFHEVCGVYMENEGIRFNLDAALNHEGHNDFFNVKMGLPIKGVRIFMDREHKLENALKNVYQDLLDNGVITKDKLVDLFVDNFDFDDIIENKFSYFIDFVKNNNILGTELAELFVILYNKNCFNGLTFSFVGFGNGLYEDDVNNTSRVMLVEMNNKYFIFDMTSYVVREVSMDYLNELFNDKLMAYQNKHVIRGIG